MLSSYQGTFKEFRLGDLFNYYRGKESAPKQLLEGSTKLISETTSNNGYVKDVYSDNIFDGHCITVSVNFASTVFYQEDEFCASVNIIILRPKLDVSKEFLLYVCSALSKNNMQYDYQNKISKDKLLDTYLLLPTLDGENPDYAFMESYIKHVQNVYINNLKNRYDEEIETLKTLANIEQNGGGSDLNELSEIVRKSLEMIQTSDVEYATVKLGDLFEIINGKRVRSQDQIPGGIPYVTALTTNNGIENYISNPSMLVEDCLSINFFGNVFYHPYKVSFKDGTYGVKAKTACSREVYLYVASVLEKACLGKYSYEFALRTEELKNTEIQLPVKKGTNLLDFGTMEAYIKYIEAKYIQDTKAQQDEELEQLLNLTGLTFEDIRGGGIPTNS